MLMRGNVAPGISAAGVFDGLDIDWECPGSCGDTCNFRRDGRQNFPALLAEFRRQPEALETEVENQSGVRPEYLLTSAAPAGARHYTPKVLAAKGWPSFRDQSTATHWIFNGNDWWSYDDEQSLAWKAGYVNGEPGAPTMAGMMFWGLSGDAPDVLLLRAMRAGLTLN